MESALKRESNIIEGPHTVLSSLLQFFISVILTFQTSQLILSWPNHNSQYPKISLKFTIVRIDSKSSHDQKVLGKGLWKIPLGNTIGSLGVVPPTQVVPNLSCWR